MIGYAKCLIQIDGEINQQFNEFYFDLLKFILILISNPMYRESPYTLEN